MNLNMNSSEALVAQIQGLSSTAADLSQLHESLKKSEEFLRAQSSRFNYFLTELDPANHSLGYLYVLDAFLSGPVTKECANDISLSTARFINVCAADQIRLAPEKFISLCRKFKEHLLSLNAPMRGVGPMLAALRKIQLSTEQLTALHPEFLQLCLLAKCYKTGLCVLEDDIFEVDQPRDLFLYCYYGGMICIGQKRFQKALDLLRNVVTAPMSAVSSIAVEAYKKYILVSLIHLGQFPSSFPKYTSSVAQRNLKTFSQPYLELATSYSTGKISELQTSVQSNREKFESASFLVLIYLISTLYGITVCFKFILYTDRQMVEDNNFGLVNQVVSSMYKRNIQRLTQTYLTLSLQDIASTVQLSSPKEAEMHVLQMIQNGEIYATINQKDGMVRFLEDPEQYKSCGMIEHVDLSIQRIMNLSRKLTTMDELMSSDSLYLAKVGRERQRFDFDDFDSVPSKYNL